MKTPYFLFYPKDWLSDPRVTQLTYEERGIYLELLCRSQSYADDFCSLPNDDQFICRLLGISDTQWKKVKKVLVEGIAPLLMIVNGRIKHREVAHGLV